MAGSWDWSNVSVPLRSAPLQAIFTSSVSGDNTTPRPTAALGVPDVPQHSPAGTSAAGVLLSVKWLNQVHLHNAWLVVTHLWSAARSVSLRRRLQ